MENRVSEFRAFYESLFDHPLWDQLIQATSEGSFSNEFNRDIKELQKIESSIHDPSVVRKMIFKLASIGMDLDSKVSLLKALLNLNAQQIIHLDQGLSSCEAFYRLIEQAQKIRTITFSLLDFGKTSQGVDNFCLHDLCQNTLVLFRAELRKYGVQVENEIPSDRFIRFNKSDLMQILANLINNGIDAVKELDEDQRWIRLQLHDQDSESTFEISNGGPSLEDEVQQVLFQRRFTTKGDKGNGLGLYLSRKLAAKNNSVLEFNKSSVQPSFTLLIKSQAQEAA